MSAFSFTLQAQKGAARAGILHTPHGDVETPIFMPVGTLATLKSLDTEDIDQLEAQIILANTYHLYLRPGMRALLEAGGVHGFMHWNKPVLTDSGGFQVFSLGAGMKPGADRLARITDGGVAFRSHLDGTRHFFTPEKAVELQRQIGADIIMNFDECTPTTASPEAALESVERTFAWAKRCKAYWDDHGRLSHYGQYQALFGIVQGGVHPELRKKATEQLLSLEFDGMAFGGETIGYDMETTSKVLSWVEAILPPQMPRYAMGVGRDPQDVVTAALAGYDMFDCVSPTRLARNGAVYVGSIAPKGDSIEFVSEFSKGRLQIGNSRFAYDHQVLQPGCDCHTCTKGYTRSYLHHLYKTGELTYYRLASIHNVRTFLRLAGEVRKFIMES